MESIKWQRPKTTRVYVHPPVSNRMYTLWREGKVVLGDAKVAINDEYYNLISSGIRVLFGDGELDFHTNEYKVREDGIPVHKLFGKTDKLSVELTAYATAGLDSALRMKLTLSGNTSDRICERVGIMMRTAKESELVFSAPDLYDPYRSDLEEWRSLPASFAEYEGGLFVDGDRKIRISSQIPLAYDALSGIAFLEITLEAGESIDIYVDYSKGAMPSDSFDSGMAATVAFWEGELARITRLPLGITQDPHKLSVVKNLTVQILQCFARPIDSNRTFARQGGLQRQIWTYENMPVLESLMRIGNFEKYIDPIMELYFEDFWEPSGQVVPFGVHWAMTTGTVLYSFATYSLLRGRELYEKYADRAYRAFRWIKSTRRSVEETPALVAGLFPPMSSCDDILVFQSWSNTDSFNVIGLGKLAEAAEKYGDPRAAEIKSEYGEYKATMRGVWQRIIDESGDPDELDIPFAPKGDNEEISKKFIFISGASYVAVAIDMPREEAEKVLRYRRRNGTIRGGLYARMPDKNKTPCTKHNLDETGKCDVWYVSARDYYWFCYFLRHGEFDKCREILRDNEAFAMTDEFYMLERYKASDPWFTPWMPNASANGRTILMMLDMAKTDEDEQATSG